MEGGSSRSPGELHLYVDWADKNNLALAQLHRKQNTATVFIADAASGVAKPVFTDTDAAWVDVPEIATGRFETKTFEWLKGRKSLLWLSERDGWRHAYSVPRYGDKRTLLTSGDWDVVSIVGVDAESRWLYFIASPGSAVDRYLYRAQIDASGPAP